MARTLHTVVQLDPGDPVTTLMQASSRSGEQVVYDVGYWQNQ
ncbi:hypothetical protein [Promicromonospora iranensis]|uniref:Uncharacterized protein n=1 Tax=Promicromonospora iranensis TaxID=1105144 RepID=A0ABU2CGM7_9MICO|nr:hypothetical protein [Promicromonospora iranensis]MDR7380493.1 hypothetical protein [Promicromonospora iranensis]